MIEFAQRLHSVKEYYFSTKLKEVRQLIKNGKPIINMGIGSPDLNPPKAVLNALNESLTSENAHKYQSYQGLPEFRDAITSFYEHHYNVLLNSETEVLPLMGSKEGILHISMALLNEGDGVLIPNPGYPTYTSVTKLVGASPIFYDLIEENNYQPNFKKLEQLDLLKVKIMWVNYPHMPTGTKGTDTTFKQLIDFGKKHNILIVNDNPYSFILNNTPKSILAYEGAKDVALELNSLSKTFNMAGWRVGMLLGNKNFINEILKVKTQMDSGMFYSIQKGAIAALETPRSWIINQNKIYDERKKLIQKLALKLNCSFSDDTTGLFVWAKLPDEIESADIFINELLYDKHIFIAPGHIFGSKGEKYIRFSLCVDTTKIKEAINRI